MARQSIMVIILGCILADNAFTSAITFSRPIARKRSDLTDGEELLQALEFLERYDGARRPGNLENRIDSNYVLVDDDGDDVVDYDDLIIPYDASLSQNLVDMNGLPPPPWTPDFSRGINEAYNAPAGNSNSQMSIGQRVEQNADFNDLLNRLVEDAIMEDMLREDAAKAAEIIEADIADDATDGSSYSSEQEVNYAVYDGSYDINAPSYTVDDDYGAGMDESSYQASDTYDVDGEEEIDKSLLEAVILRLAEGEMKQKLLEEEEEEAESEESEMDEYEDISSSYGNIPEGDRDTEEEVGNFVENIMAELMEGSQDLADKLINEIDEEKEILDEEEMLEEEEDNDPYGDVVFSNGWDTDPLEPADDVSICPALDYILDDCSVVDDFPGLGDEGYKEGFGESCNRHQLCYFCSGTFEIPVKLCDETFKMELMSICSEDPECDFRAKYFWLSAIASRAPSPVDLSVCKQPCVMGYLLDN